MANENEFNGMVNGYSHDQDEAALPPQAQPNGNDGDVEEIRPVGRHDGNLDQAIGSRVGNRIRFAANVGGPLTNGYDENENTSMRSPPMYGAGSSLSPQVVEPNSVLYVNDAEMAVGSGGPADMDALTTAVEDLGLEDIGADPPANADTATADLPADMPNSALVNLVSSGAAVREATSTVFTSAVSSTFSTAIATTIPAEIVASVGGSTTADPQPRNDVTKRILRVDTWKRIQDNRLGVGFNGIFNRIPGFVDSHKAGLLLAQTDEFKRATEIKVNIERALESAKMHALRAGKRLYLPATTESNAIYWKVQVDEAAGEGGIKEALHTQDIYKHRKEISLDEMVVLDMIVIGSVLVSRGGHRIGRGHGFVDLDIGLLIEVGAITNDTTIVTMVHDIQVVNRLPTHLFEKFDAPVDMIVTPTQVIRVAERLPRPSGIFWELLSRRRLNIVPVLKLLKQRKLQEGSVLAIKEEDTDIETGSAFNGNNRRRGAIRRRIANTNQRPVDDAQGDMTTERDMPSQYRNRSFTNRLRRPIVPEVQLGQQVRTEDWRDRRNVRSNADFCIKLSNLVRGIRIKDVKSELRRRNCNPLYITWRGQSGRCFLHFGNRNGVPSTQQDINKVIGSLNDFSVTVTAGYNRGSQRPTRGRGAAGGSGGGGVGGSAHYPQQQQQRIININVELIQFEENPVPRYNSRRNEGAAGGIAAAAPNSTDDSDV